MGIHSRKCCSRGVFACGCAAFGSKDVLLNLLFNEKQTLINIYKCWSTLIQLILNTSFINKITGHLEKGDVVTFSLSCMVSVRCYTPISVTASEVPSDCSSTATSSVCLCVVVPRLMQKETKIHSSWGWVWAMIACGPFTRSTRGSYHSEMPPQICKHYVMCLILSKIVISLKYMSVMRQNNKERLWWCVWISGGNRPQHAQAKNDPEGADFLSQLCCESFQLE